MVAKEVTVTSRAYGEAEAYTWKSDGIEGYTIEPATPEEAATIGGDHGTCITLHLKETRATKNTTCSWTSTSCRP